MSNMRTKATNFNDLRKEFREQELTFVSTHGVNESLKETYVSYIDLMGFLHTLSISAHSLIHKTTRFHRALDLAFATV